MQWHHFFAVQGNDQHSFELLQDLLLIHLRLQWPGHKCLRIAAGLWYIIFLLCVYALRR